jgi:hypothetical protein
LSGRAGGKEANAERPTPNAERRIKTEGWGPKNFNAQLPTFNAQRSMKIVAQLVVFLMLWAFTDAYGQNSDAGFDAKAAERFAQLALDCVHKEYPNKISHVLNSDADVAPPRNLTPTFCGCYDWHSSVHGHWLLVRLMRTFPDAKFAAAARQALMESFTDDNLTK